GRRPARHLSLIEYRVCSNMCWHGGQHLLFAVNQIAGTEGRDFKPVAVRDGVRRAGLDAISTEDTSIIVDVINLGVALSAAHAMVSGALRRFDIYAIGGAGCRAQEAGYTLLQAILIALQDMDAAIPLLKFCSSQRTRPVGIVLHDGGLEH